MVQVHGKLVLCGQGVAGGFFGDGFNRNAMSGASVEDIPKADAERDLRSATRSPARAPTARVAISFDILRGLDAGKVCAASPHAKRLIETLLANNPRGDVV